MIFYVGECQACGVIINTSEERLSNPDATETKNGILHCNCPVCKREKTVELYDSRTEDAEFLTRIY